MRSALECFHHAAICERMARATNNQINRRTLLVTAELWRQLGSDAKAKETGPSRNGSGRRVSVALACFGRADSR